MKKRNFLVFRLGNKKKNRKRNKAYKINENKYFTEIPKSFFFLLWLYFINEKKRINRHELRCMDAVKYYKNIKET